MLKKKGDLLNNKDQFKYNYLIYILKVAFREREMAILIRV